jgi:mRNA interferase MazF
MAVRRTTQVPEAGDIVWVNLNPTAGHEQAGRRPVVVVSFKAFNEVSLMCTVVPVTSVSKGYTNEVAVTSEKVSGCALVDQVRSLDLAARTYEKKGVIGASQLTEIRTKLGVILGILR